MIPPLVDGRPAGHRSRPRRVRQERQADREERLHLRPPRRLDAGGDHRPPRPAATRRSSARTGAASSACASSPRTPIASPGSSSATPACRPANTRRATRSWRGRSSARRPRCSTSGSCCNSATITELSDGEVAAYDAPFPDDTYKAGARIFPSLVPTTPDDPAAAANTRGVGGLQAVGQAVHLLLQRQRPGHRRRRQAVPPARARRPGPAARDGRERPPLLPGRRRAATRADRHRRDHSRSRVAPSARRFAARSGRPGVDGEIASRRSPTPPR